MITYIKISGFKSFHEFEMGFTPLTVIAGSNASGKSNLFDALKLLSSLAETDNIKRAFKGQRGDFLELFTQYEDGEYAKEMTFEVDMLVNQSVTDAWGNTEMLKYTRLKYELKIERFTNEAGLDDIQLTHERLINLKHQEDTWIKSIPAKNREAWRPKVTTGKRGIPYMDTTEYNGKPTVEVPQDGTTGNKRRFPLSKASRTVLSSFDTIDFPHVLAAKEEMKSWKFLQLNPDLLRKPTDKSTGEDQIGEGGENLAAALHRISIKSPWALAEISRKLQVFVPEFIEVQVVDDHENKQFVIKLIDKDGKTYSSRVLSEGTLRILALCILEHDELHTGLLCFEEPENGIHPFRIKAMAELLKDLSTDFEPENLPLRQAIVNTHSPALINVIDQWTNEPKVADSNVSLWYTKIASAIVRVGARRFKMNISKITSVEKVQKRQLSFLTPEADQKITTATVRKLLQTASTAEA